MFFRYLCQNFGNNNNILLFTMRKQNPEVHSYIQTQINPFIEPLVYQLVLQRPSNPVQFAIEWLVTYSQRPKLNTKSTALIDSDTEDECQDQVRELEIKIEKKKANRSHHKSRMGISQQVFGQFNLREDIVVSELGMNENEKILVKSLLRSSILFQNLDSKDEQVLLKAIVSKQTDEHELIIKEGEAGNVLYIVESGEYDCYKEVNGENEYIKTYLQGEAFGQLALMYNAPRAASIVTKKPGKLLLLDRCTFSCVLKVAALRKQEIIKGAIDKLQILKAIPQEQKHQLVNILKEEKYPQGQYIIRENEEGNKFYIVLDGTLIAEKQEGNELPKIVFKYEEGDYFGELALLNNSKRKASVKAITAVKLAVVSREGFKRVFGQIQEAFKQQSQKYHG